MKKYVFSALLSTFMLSLSAQTVDDQLRNKVLADSILREDDLTKKIAIFNSDEVQAIIQKDPLQQISLGYTITQRYIEKADKDHAFEWLEKMKYFPQIYNAMWLSFYETFAEKGEYSFIDSKISSSMDSVYRILSDSSTIASETYGFYSTRLRYFVENKMNLKDYAGALKHLDLVFRKFKQFNDNANFYQYVQALVQEGRHEEAITVLATLYTNGTDFSPELRETRAWLTSNVPNGEDLFEREVEGFRATQRQNFQHLLSRSEELYGRDLKDEISQKKYVLLSFWGTWCIPCIQTHPKLKNLYSRYKDHGLEILSLASENGKDSIVMESNLKASIEKQELNWLHTMLKGQNAAGHPYLKYNVQGYPTKILIDNEGVILGKFTGSSYTNDSNLERLLAENMGDEESKARTIKIRSARVALEDFEKATGLEQREKLYHEFTKTEELNIAEIALIKDGMLESIITTLVDSGKQAEALEYYNSIEDYVIKSAVALQLVEQLSSQAEKLSMLAENLDRYNLDLPQEHSNIYTKLVQAYLDEMTEEKNSAQTEKYLQTLFTSNGFFISDVITHTGVVPFQESLSYQLAKAEAAQSNPVYLARILNVYLSTDSLYQAMKPGLLAEFKHVTGLERALEEGRSRNSLYGHGQMLRKLMLKEDINGTVQGAKAIAKKHVLVDFWGSWCAPCRAGHPHLKELYEKYKGDQFEIVAVSYEGRGDLDVAIANWNTAVATDGLPWVNVLSVDRERSGFDPVKDFGVNAFPTKILLDPAGKVLGTYGGDSAALDAKLKELFGK